MNVETPIDLFLGEALPSQENLASLPEELAWKAVDRLKQEADRHWGIDPHRSLDFADRIVAIGRARGDDRQAALGMMARGDALKLLGRTGEAWEALETAGQMFLGVGDEVGWARTRIGRLYLSPMLQNVAEALAEAEIAREIFTRWGEREKLLRLEIQTAYVLNHLGNPLEAIARFSTALEIAGGLGEAGRPYDGYLHLNMGSAYETLGDLSQAQVHYERARARFAEEGETLLLAHAETNIGYLAQSQGNYRRALQLLTRSLEAAAGNSELEATKIKWHLLECYLGLNRLSEARDLARQIVAEARRINDSFELARVLLQLAAAEAELNQLAAAQSALNEAEGIFAALDTAPWKAMAALRRGQIALKQGDFAAALQAARETAPVFEASGQKIHQAEAILLQGQAHQALDDLSSAGAAGAEVLETARGGSLPALRYSAHLLLGQGSEKENNLPRALRHYAAAAAVTERVQRGLTITLRPGFLEDKAGAWRALIGLCLRLGRAASAFEALERAKSQVLLGYLLNREHLRWAKEDASSRILIAELELLRAEHHWFYRMAQEEGIGGPGLDPHLAAAEAKGRERRLRAITEQLYLRGAEGQLANPIQTPTVGDIQGTLDERTLFIEYYNDGSQVWAFTLDGRSIEFHPLPVAVEVLNGYLAQLQVNLAAALKVSPQAGAAAQSLALLGKRILQRLYAALIEPLAPHLAGKERLVIVPYGALHYLPFHLLYHDTAYLIETCEVVVLPAAGLALHPGPVRKPGALVLAHSWEGRLPQTQTEGQIVHRLFEGAMFTEAAANRAVFQAEPLQVLHIAAHGQFRLDQPDLSYIQLADGQLWADDLLQQDLSYELVTLSACETGRANVAGGEELIGLGRGFLYAGAGALVLSLWPVADAITIHIMEEMYLALRAGASKAAALRAAQRKMLDQDRQVHPAFWGAFQLVGAAGPLSLCGMHAA